MKHIYFVRHGLSLMNQQGVFSSSSNTPLTPEGIEQCQQAAQQLKDAGIDCIVSSPIERALHSAQIIAAGIGFDASKIITNELFVERSFGPLEGTTYSPTANLDGTVGVEHSSELIARVNEGLAFLRGLEADTILVVAHGAVGRALRHLLDPTIPFHGSEKFANAQVQKLL